MSSAGSNTTILIAPGTYTLTSTLYLNGVNGVTLRGATDNRDDVVLVGRGMSNSNFGNVEFGIWTNGQRVTIANLTLRDLYDHAIVLNAGAESPHIYNVHLINTGQQFIKSNPDGGGGGVDDGIVEYSVIEYTSTSRDDYTNGVDVHTGANWVVRHNLFRNLMAPSGALAGPAILIWNGSRGAIVESNSFVNCQREISMGLTDRPATDNSGGIVRNNFIFRRAGIYGDAGILVADSPGTEVLHNTVLLNGTYQNAIEYRFSGTTGGLIVNNLTSAAIQGRDGATGTVNSNYTSATASMFVNAASGDLHLVSSATAAIDKVATPANAPKDWDGDSRPGGTTADYGADEFSGGATAPPAPGPSNQPPGVNITGPASGATFNVPASIDLSADAADSDGTVTSVSFYNGGTLLGTDTSSPYSYSWTNVPAGSYTLTAVAVDNSGASATASPVNVTVSQGGSEVPAPWTTADIGSPSVAGGTGFVNGAFTVQGGGVDIWDTSDQFRFMYQQIDGDVDVVARVASLTNPNEWAKAGVMIRQELTGNSVFAMSVVTPMNGVAFQRRTGVDAYALHTPGAANAAPHWVRLVRLGSSISSYQSADGSAWSLVGTETIPMGSTVYVGLAVTSHDDRVPANALFTGVQITTPSVTTPTTPTAPAPGKRLVFTPSTDHDANVTSYTLQIFAAGDDPLSATAVASQNLGKPAVVAGTISVDIQALVAALPSGSFIASVTAVGPGGSTRGPSSNSFVH